MQGTTVDLSESDGKMMIGKHVYFGCHYEFGMDLAKGKDKSVVKELSLVSDHNEKIADAKAKWERVVASLDEVAKALYSKCTLCDLYVCETCPLGTPEKGPGRGCVDYSLISDDLSERQKAAKRVLRVINSIKPECEHPTEIELTARGDTERYYACVLCGQHRTEPLK